MAVSPRELFDLAHPFAVGIPIDHVLGRAPRFGAEAEIRERVDGDRGAFGCFGRIGEASVAFARKVERSLWIATL